MSGPDDPADPKGLIREGYRIAEISEGECRTIFLDWAVAMPEAALAPHIRALLDRYGPRFPDHPMTKVLREGLAPAPSPRRRGGGRARRH